MDHFIFIIEIIGTIAFAISGALTGFGKNMDIFGVAILGVTTATGGGMIRDLILGQTPPATFSNPIYVLLSVIASIIVFILGVRHRLASDLVSESGRKIYELVMLISDSAGLGIFTVVGVKVAIDAGFIENSFLIIFVAVVTGVGGGVLRDVFAGDRPYIFVKHIYACASIAGAIVCALMWNIVGQNVSMAAGFAVVTLIRLLAARFRWSLPRPHN